MPTDLASRLRTATRELHSEVEKTGVMADLLGGCIERATYAALLRNLHAIYAALESALDAAGADPLLQALPTQALRREAALAADLDSLAGAGWRDRVVLAPAAAEYAARLAAASAPLLVAHGYVRYLGDLNGGQVLARLVQRSFGPAAGTRFYDFGGEERVAALRKGFRGALAALQPAAHDGAAIVDEACWAFRQHARLFEELAA